MANPAYDDLESTVWTALYDVLESETNIGATGPGSGSNPTGRLQTCADLRKSIHLWTQRLPAIGVQSLGYEAARYSTQFDILTIRFHIIAAANSLPSGAVPANMDASNATLQPLISDGSGNGVGPILRDPENFFLGTPGVIETWLSGVERSWEVESGQTPQVWSYALFTYIVKVKAFTGTGG
jgi:hypothetical protein